MSSMDFEVTYNALRAVEKERDELVAEVRRLRDRNIKLMQLLGAQQDRAALTEESERTP